MDARVTRAGAADEERVGRERAANPNSPARLSPVFNPQKFPSASGALGTRATKGRSLGKINTSSARRLPAFAARPGRPVSHFVASASEEKGSPRPEGARGPRGGRPPAARCMWLCGWGPAGVHLPPRPAGQGHARAPAGPAAAAATQVPPPDAPGHAQPAPGPAPGPRASVAPRVPGLGSPRPAVGARTPGPGPAAPSPGGGTALPPGWDIYFWW